MYDGEASTLAAQSIHTLHRPADRVEEDAVMLSGITSRVSEFCDRNSDASGVTTMLFDTAPTVHVEESSNRKPRTLVTLNATPVIVTNTSGSYAVTLGVNEVAAPGIFESGVSERQVTSKLRIEESTHQQELMTQKSPHEQMTAM